MSFLISPRRETRVYKHTEHSSVCFLYLNLCCSVELSSFSSLNHKVGLCWRTLIIRQVCFHCSQTTGRIITELGGRMWCESGEKPLQFGVDLDQGVDPKIIFSLSLTLQDCLFWENNSLILDGKSGIFQLTWYLWNLVQIQMNIWIWYEF